MTFEAQQKSVQDNGNYEGAKINCLQKLEPEQWRFCGTKPFLIHLNGPNIPTSLTSFELSGCNPV